MTAADRLQAKDIPDGVFVQAVADCSVRAAAELGVPGSWCNRWDVGDELSRVLGFEVPQKVVLAKAARILKRGRMAGCACGCRGGFDLRGYPADPFVKHEGA